MPFEFVPLEIPGFKLIKPRIFGDERGFLLEIYKHSDFSHARIGDILSSILTWEEAVESFLRER